MWRAWLSLVFVGLACTKARADLIISMDFVAELSSGTDVAGIDGSSWRLIAEISQPTYTDALNAGVPVVIPDQVSLTTSGGGLAAPNLGSFVLTEEISGDFFLAPDDGGNADLFGNLSVIGSQFSFGSITVDDFRFFGSSVASVSIGDPVAPGDFAGLSLMAVSPGFMDGTGTYVANGVATVSIVPESATAPLFAALLTLLLILLRKRFAS